MQKQIILASSSRYRQEVLSKLGLPFTVCAPNIDESPRPNETPADLVLRLAIAKARAVLPTRQHALVIGSDQVAVCNGAILGKPRTHDNAVKQLRETSGQTIALYTGLALINSDSGRVQSDVVPFRVVMRALSDNQIENYLRKEQPYDCAGSVKSERLGVALLDRFEGDDPNALIGLPLIRLVRMLETEGVNPI